MLHVVSASGTLAYVGLGFVSGFERENPTVELRMEDLTNRLVDEALTARSADIGLMVGPIDPQRYDAELFSVHPHLLIVDRNDPLVAVLNAMRPMVSRDGAVLVSADFWAQATAGPGHVIVPFEDKTLSWNIYLVRRRGETLEPAGQAFWDYALAWSREHRAATGT